ncbi:MAG: hypothetical protein ABIW81_03375 [Terrimesophilobacter sp.]
MQTSSNTWRHFPRPEDEPHVEVDGPDPIRILMMGGGPSVGYAVLTHQLGLGGHLARQISALTGRGCQLDIVTSPDMMIHNAPDLLHKQRLDDYDLLVTTFGGNEALALMSTRTWRNQTSAMLAAIHNSDARPNFHVFMIGISPISTIVNLPSTMASVVDDRVTRFNSTTARLASIRTNRSFIPLTAASIRMSDVSGASAYTEWARQIVPAMSPVLLNSGE